MSRLWTAKEAAEATGGKRMGPDWQAAGVSIDTRSMARGDLFVALRDQRDGHDFVASALANGAAAALVSHVPEGVDSNAPLLLVPDVLQALEDLARTARARSQARVVAVTGSVGKTSTKDMLSAALSGQGCVHAAEKSYNNQWGVPLTLARLPRGADYAIIEIGMNHAGETAPLARLARPHVAMITTVAAVHMEAFDSLDSIAREKAAIFSGLEKQGVAVVNGDLATTPLLCAAAQQAGAGCETFGISKSCTHRLLDVQITNGKTVARARIGKTALLFKLATAGRHFAMNGLGALVAVQALGADLAQAVCGLSAWQPPAGRGTRETVFLDSADAELNFELIDDAFNANPTSVSAALEVLEATTPRDGVGRIRKGRRIAILGDMLELGQDEMQMHADLARLPSLPKLDLIHCVGPRMHALWQALPQHQRGAWTETAQDLCEQVYQLVDAGDVVLVKGSKGAQVSLLVDVLRNLGHPEPADKQGQV